MNTITPSNPPTTHLPRDLTAQKVIEIFVELMLPVCDDESRIRQAIEKQRPKRMKELGNPCAEVSQRAKEWVKHSLWLTNYRTELLDMVYKQFEQQADLPLQAMGQNTETIVLTPELYESLSNIARDGCKVDDALTRYFIERYKREHGWTEGGNLVLVEPAIIEDLTAACTGKSIILKWKHSNDRRSKVLIYRTTKDTNSSAGSDKPVGEATGDYYEDHTARPGDRYVYRVCSTYGKAKGAQSIITIPYPGDVEEAKAELANGKVTLTWKKPTSQTTVWVFRREGDNPGLRFKDDLPVPSGDHTLQLSCGNSSGFVDGNLREGVTYHYLIVSDFGQGLITKGVVRQVHVPLPPPAVPLVKASYFYDHSQGKEETHISWDPAPTSLPVSYRLVRREGSVPPDRPDGPNSKIIEKSTSQTSARDPDVVSGKRYTYAVFTVAGDVYSRTSTASKYVDILTDVTDLKKTTGNQTVELQWNAPLNVSEVRVRRLLDQYPKKSEDGFAIPVIGNTAVNDTGLTNGRNYCYKVFCIYRPEGGVEVLSAGVCISAIPVPDLPDAINLDFKVMAFGSMVECTWNKPTHGQVVIRRLSAPHDLRPGGLFDSARLDKMGEVVTGAGDGRALDTKPDIKTPWYSIFVVSGSNAVAGETKSCVVVQDVTDLKLARTMSGFVLTWDWPQACETVTVARRFDQYPESPDDPQAFGIPIPYARKDYDDAGAKFTDPVNTKEPWIHYSVFARASSGSIIHHAKGNTDGCRAKAHAGPWTVLRYKIHCPTKRPYKGSHIHLSWWLDDPMPDFAGFALVADKDKAPSDLDQGIKLFRTSADQAAARSGEAWVSLEEVQRRQWGQLFCKAFVAKPLQQPFTIIIHPNTCVRLTDRGRIDTIPAKHRGKIWKPGTPRTITCPVDFQEFPVEEILYGRSGNSERIKAKYTVLDRIWGGIRGRKRGRKQVKDSDGMIYTQKYCPQGHLLPVTADRQESLTIGLIGAKYSGKTHYVGSLVNRLIGQAGDDLGIGVFGVTDETNKRYEQEFKRPLIEKHRQLEVTIGTPPPLIYELTRTDNNQYRSVNLALYETAGESLHDPVKARDMVKYLSVAAGVILLVDPLQIESVRQSLPAAFPKPPVDTDASPCGIINNISDILSRDGQKDILSIPVAIVLAKCDVLRDAGLIEPNRLWCMEDKRHIGYFHNDWHEDMSGMMEEYLRRWDMQAYNTITKKYPRHAFFGVSSTGCSSEGGRFKFVSPWRVEDPLVWLLTELGVLRTEQEHG